MRSPVVLVRSSTCPVKNEYGQVRGELQRIISDRVMIKTFFGHSFSACFKFQVSGLILFGCPVRGTKGNTQVPKAKGGLGSAREGSGTLISI